MSYDTRLHADGDEWTASQVMRTVFASTLNELVAVMYDSRAETCWPCTRCDAVEAFATTVNTWRCRACRASGTAVDLALVAAVDPKMVEKLAGHGWQTSAA